METYKKFYNGILKYSILLLFITFLQNRNDYGACVCQYTNVKRPCRFIECHGGVKDIKHLLFFAIKKSGIESSIPHYNWRQKCLQLFFSARIYFQGFFQTFHSCL